MSNLPECKSHCYCHYPYYTLNLFVWMSSTCSINAAAATTTPQHHCLKTYIFGRNVWMCNVVQKTSISKKTIAVNLPSKLLARKEVSTRPLCTVYVIAFVCMHSPFFWQKKQKVWGSKVTLSFTLPFCPTNWLFRCCSYTNSWSN